VLLEDEALNGLAPDGEEGESERERERD